MPQQPTKPGSNRNSESKSDERLSAALASTLELYETVEWCRERRRNPKGPAAPPPNERIFEARVQDAVWRYTYRVEDHRESQLQQVPGRPVGLAVRAAAYFPLPRVNEWIAKHLLSAQRALLSDPGTDERLCDHLLDAAVAQAVDNAVGLAVPELRARASALGWELVPPAQYADFYRREVLPAWSRAGGEVRLCLECGEPFALADNRKRYCSKPCSARQRNRGRQKVGKGLSAPETARKRLQERIQRHWDSCKVCRRGQPCASREAMLQADDALAHLSPGMTPEHAEEMQASSGRQRKRGAR